MKVSIKSIHEPEADLLSTEDAIGDAEGLRVFFQQRQRAEPSVPLRMPLWALLEAIDALEVDALRQISRSLKGRRAWAVQRTGFMMRRSSTLSM